jgi:hypothetical protein
MAREGLGVLVEVAGEGGKDLPGDVHQDAGVVVLDEGRACLHGIVEASIMFPAS